MGSGMTIRAGFHTSPFGDCLIGELPQGICHLSFFEKAQAAAAIAEMTTAWPNAEIVWDHDHSAQLGAKIFAPGGPPPLRVFMRGTPFQIRIWRALLDIPFGTVNSYGMLAATVGHPNASRATGSAVGKNEVSYLIPCHRVVRSDGHCGNYRWGPARKLAMLEWEARTLLNDAP
jgi:AraC family transcriptional regulator of adaptative response/methylated-DNA-[protein]-cysteine methyltransferase